MPKVRLKVNGREVTEADLAKQPSLAPLREIARKAERAILGMRCSTHDKEIVLAMTLSKGGAGLALEACCPAFEKRAGAAIESALAR